MQTYIDRFLNGLHTRVKMDFLTWMYRGFLKNPHGNRPLAMANAEHLTAAAEAINSVCTSHSYQATPVGVTLENFHIYIIIISVGSTVDVRLGAERQRTELHRLLQRSQTHIGL